METKKGLVVAALMMALSLAALDSTVVGTAMPTIVGTLGGLSLFSWVFSVYLLTSTVTVPIYGKLADLYGRKPVLMLGAVLFLAGSALCGTAQGMEELIAFRAVQGLGAGAVQPITMTIIGDVFSVEQRARIQGLFSSVWGISSVTGPALGGLITDSASWRWVFLVNLPLGITSIVLLWTCYRERTEKHGHVIDYWGTSLLTGSIVALLLALLQGANRYGWVGGETLGLIAVSALLLALFIWQEGRTREPVLPLGLFRNRVIAVSSLAGFVTGGLMFGVSSYVPLFAQGVFGGTAIDAGLVLAPMSIGWPLGSVVSGRMILKTGYYPTAMLGSAFLVVGSAGLLTVGKESPQALLMATVCLIGLGMGFTASAFIISVQNAVDWGQRGIATASTQFFRTIGGSISVAIMGAVLNSEMSSRLRDIPGAPTGSRANSLLDPATRSSLGTQVLDAMQRALAASLHEIYFLVFGAAVISFAIVLFFPRGRVHELSHEARTRAAPVEAAEPAEESVVLRGGPEEAG